MVADDDRQHRSLAGRYRIERHFDLAALLFLILLVGGVAVLRPL